MDSHDRAVAYIASTVRKYYARKEPFRIYHGSTNSTRQSQYLRDKMVDISGLSNILIVDTQSKTALVEPNVPMDALVEATLRYGLIPPVVMEFPGITLGGGFAGTAGESSSFRYGFFDRTINWIEMVLGDGEIVKASNTENSDLFYAAASSFGTLGVTTLLEVQLIEAKKFVVLTYVPVSNIAQAQEKIEEAVNDPSVAYLDGFLLAANKGVICVGRLSNDVDPGVRIQRFTRRSDPWFYLHAQNLVQKHAMPITEAVPIVDYLFRYDRGGFWVARYSFKYFITPFNPITRWILDYFMHTRVMYHALHKSGLYNQHIIQDVAIPYTETNTFMSYLESNFDQYPIWLCPLKQSGKTASTHSLQAGSGPKKREDFVAWNRVFEQKVHALGGQKWLYAHTYYSEKEFYEIYNRTEYDVLREKYRATYLPTVYDKVKVDIEKEKRAVNESWNLWLLAFFWSIWPLAGLYGVYKAIRGGDYLLPKKLRRSS